MEKLWPSGMVRDDALPRDAFRLAYYPLLGKLLELRRSNETWPSTVQRRQSKYSRLLDRVVLRVAYICGITRRDGLEGERHGRRRHGIEP